MVVQPSPLFGNTERGIGLGNTPLDSENEGLPVLGYLTKFKFHQQYAFTHTFRGNKIEHGEKSK